MNDCAVLFDLDGTLLDTLGDLTDSVNYILGKYGYPLRTMSEVRGFLGYGAGHLIKCALPDGIEQRQVDAYTEEYKGYYKAHSQIKTGPYDGIVWLLRELKGRGIATAVVSNKPDPATKALCKEYFGELIDLALGELPEIEKKPSAAPLHYAMEALGCNKAVFVGDAETDVLAAKNADMPCVSVTWGFRDKDVLEECGACIFADDAATLAEKLLSLLGVNGEN